MAKRGKITRKTEQEAIDPQFNRVDKRFIAPYGLPVSEYTINRTREDDPELFETIGDMAIIDHSGMWANERHSRMMQRDFLAQHERRVDGQTWQHTEATDYQEQLEQSEQQKFLRKQAAQFAWVDKYFNQELATEVLPNQEFETMDFDDKEIIPPSTTNQLSPIFSSTGKVIKVKEHSVICSPQGDTGIRKELPAWAYSSHKNAVINAIVITIDGKEYKHTKGDLLPEKVSFALTKRLVDMGHTLEQAAEIIIERYYK